MAGHYHYKDNSRYGGFRPEETIPLFEVDDSSDKLGVRVVMSGDEFKNRIQYPVIVESWEKKNYGRGKKAYLKEFTEKERKTLSRWHTTFYGWHLRTGTPLRACVDLKTLPLLRRACSFFATV